MTRAEAFQIMMVPRQIVSPQGNKPVIGIVQDTLLGVSKFTRRDTFLERDMMFNTLMHLESWNGDVPIPCILKPRPLWSGKQILSLIIPRVNLKRLSVNHDEEELERLWKEFTAEYPEELKDLKVLRDFQAIKESAMEELIILCNMPFRRKIRFRLLHSEKGVMTAGDTRVRIDEGELLSGIVDVKTVGKSADNLIHVVWKEIGAEATRKLLSECQKVVNYWLLGHGFSVGIGS